MRTVIKTKEQQEIITKIDEFLNHWKTLVKEGYLNRKAYYLELKKQYEDIETYFSEFNFGDRDIRILKRSGFAFDDYNKYISREMYEKSNAVLDKIIEKLPTEVNRSKFQGCVSKYVKLRVKYHNLSNDKIVSNIKYMPDEETDKFLNTMLDKEKEVRKAKFIDQVENVGGRMLRLIELRVGDDSTLAGTISCEKCDVSLDTKGAGGYNIQIFHYRLYVRAIDRKSKNENYEKDLAQLSEEVVLTAEEKELEYMKEVVTAQLGRIEAKKDKNGKSRIGDLYDKILNLGYQELINESNYTEIFKVGRYPIYRKAINENMDIIWCLSFAYLYRKDRGNKIKDKFKLWWNVSGTDSMTSIHDMTQKHKTLSELQHIVPLMAQRGIFLSYDEVKNPKEEEEKVVEEFGVETDETIIKLLKETGRSDLPILRVGDETFKNAISKYHKDLDFDYVITMSLDTAEKIKILKTLKRMEENNYRQALLDDGFNLLLETRYYPVYIRKITKESVSCVDNGYELISPFFYYYLHHYDNGVTHPELVYLTTYTERFPRKNLDKISKRVSSSVSLLIEASNLRKKLEPYVKEQKNKEVLFSEFKIPQTQIQPIINRLAENIMNDELKERTIKVQRRLIDSGYAKILLERGFKSVSIDKRLPSLYMKKYTNELYIIFTLHQAYVLSNEGKLKLLYDLTQQKYTLADLDGVKKGLGIKEVEIFQNVNNLRKKL